MRASALLNIAAYTSASARRRSLHRTVKGQLVGDIEEWEMPCGESVWGSGRDAGDHEIGCEDCQGIAGEAQP